MPGPLTHSPADVIRHLLVNLGGGVLPSAGGSWPIYVDSEPDTPDSVITLYDTAGIIQGRTHIDGEIQEKHGILVRVRAASHTTGYTKARAIAVLMDETAKRDIVTIGGTNYFVNAITRTTDVIRLGKNKPTSNRNLFTINAIVSLRQV